MLIGIVGKKQVGKSTVTEYLVKKYGYIELAFATELKDMLIRNKIATHDSVYGDKTSYSRRMLQMIGDLMREEISTDFWIKKLENRLWSMLWSTTENVNIVISDVRYVNEANYVKQKNGTLIRVFRDTDNTDTHSSEMESDMIHADLDIYNWYSLENLYLVIDKMMKEI